MPQAGDELGELSRPSGRILGLGHLVFEKGVELLDGQAADGGVSRVEGQIDEVVELGEDGGLGEFGHARDEGEAAVILVIFQRGVKLAHGLSDLLGQFGLGDLIEGRTRL
jgi:hypothetical protein